MCLGINEFNGLVVPQVSLNELAAWDMQKKYCEASFRMEKCDENCEDCIFYQENFEDFKDMYDGMMSEIL